MPVKLKEFISWLDEAIPPEYQESYDNSGIQLGDADALISSIMLTLDVNTDVVCEAEKYNCDLIISHHPLIFKPFKHIYSGNSKEKCAIEALKKNIAIYSSHTCFDAMSWGVSKVMAEKAGIEDSSVLVPVKNRLFKLAVYVPVSHAEAVREAIFRTGAGYIGRYSSCSFNSSGTGTFKAEEGAHPWVGKMGELHSEPEVKIETALPSHLVDKTVLELKKTHPYEEPAYDIYPLMNDYAGAGFGAIGTLSSPVKGFDFLNNLKSVFGTPVIRFTGDGNKIISRVAVCGGAGSDFINAAASAGADAFVTGDLKYHSFTDAPESMLLADIGHYESEKFSLYVLYDLIIKKFPKFALRFSEIKTNPINYY